MTDDAVTIQHGQRVGRSAVSVAAIRALHAGGYVVISLLLARWLGADGYGAFSFGWSALELLIVPALIGFDILLIERLPPFLSSGATGHARSIVRWSLIIPIAASIVIAGVVLAAAPLFVPAGNITMEQCLRWSALFLPVIVWLRVRQCLLQSGGFAVWSSIPLFLIQPVTVIVAIVVMHEKWPSILTPGHSVLAVGGGFLVAAIVNECLAHLFMGTQTRGPREVMDLRPLLRGALGLSLVAGIHVVIARTDILMVGWFRGPGDAGLYTIATRAAELTTLALIAANYVTAPAFSRQYRNEDRSTLQQTYTHGARIAASGAAVVAVVLLIFGKNILAIFGPEFVADYAAMITLTLAQVFNACVGGAGTLLLMAGYRREVIFAVSVGCAVNIALNLVLIPRYGNIGAASATAVSIVVWNIVFVIQMRRRTGIVAGFWTVANESRRGA